MENCFMRFRGLRKMKTPESAVYPSISLKKLERATGLGFQRSVERGILLFGKSQWLQAQS